MHGRRQPAALYKVLLVEAPPCQRWPLLPRREFCARGPALWLPRQADTAGVAPASGRWWCHGPGRCEDVLGGMRANWTLWNGVMSDLLGLSELGRGVYSALLRAPGSGAVEIAEALSVSPADVQRELGSLVTAGALRPASTGAQTLTPVHPDLALAAAMDRRQAELDRQRTEITRARAAIAELVGDYAAGRRRAGPSAEVELLTDSEQVRFRLTELCASASTEVLSLQAQPTSDQAVAAARASDLAALDRGVRLRELWPLCAAQSRPTQRYTAELAQHGAQEKLAAVLPVQSVVVDRQLVVLPVDPDDYQRGALLVRGAGIARALVTLFEQVWRQGMQWPHQEQDSQLPLTPRQSAILSLLLDGKKDDAISRQLRLSTRTLSREIHVLMDELEAKNRVQLGMRAYERGLHASASPSLARPATRQLPSAGGIVAPSNSERVDQCAG